MSCRAFVCIVDVMLIVQIAIGVVVGLALFSWFMRPRIDFQAFAKEHVRRNPELLHPPVSDPQPSSAREK